MKKLLTLVLVLIAMSEMMSATSSDNYLLDSIVRIDESTGFVDSKKLYEYHENGTMQMSVNLRATWSSWKVGVPKILNSKTTLVYDEEGHELDYFSSVLDTATGIWKDTHHYLYDERHNRVCGVRKWNSDSTVVLQGSHYYYDEDNFQIGSDQFDTWNGVQVLDYKCENIKDAHGNKIIMVEYSKPESAWDGDYMSDPNTFNETGWVRIDSVFYTYNEKQEKTRETIYRWNNDTQEWTMDGYQIFEYDEEGHCIADTVFARDFETNVITYNNMTANTYDSHGKLSRIQMYIPNFTENGVEWIENGKYAYDYTYNENGEILQLRDYIDWQTGSSSTTYYTSTYFYSGHPAQDEPETCIFASGICGGDLTWELTCDSVLTIKGTGMMYEYSDWNSPWRPYKDSIKSVIIEEGVTTISTAAFRDHGHLQSCILPSTIESIGNEAFCFCFQLMYIEIPPSCTAFGDGSFNLVPNVIIQDESILPYSGSARSLNGYVDGLFVYDNSEKRSLRACSSAAKGVITLDDAIERIEYMAFAQCEDITHINFGSNLQYIGEWSLDGCRGLDSLQFQEGLIEIATHGFGNCFGLRYVSLPNSLTTLGDFAIGNCPDLRVIRLGDSLKYVGYQIFDYCQSIDTIYASMPTPPVLDETAFASTDLSKVICLVPDQSVSLYKEALVWKQMNVKSIDVPEPIIIASGTCGENLTWELSCDSVLTIEGSGDMEWDSYKTPWLEYRTLIAQVNLPDGLTNIGYAAFASCPNITSVTIPSTVTRIEDAAFCDNRNLSAVNIPSKVTHIGIDAFSNCTSLTSVTIPSEVVTIGNYAFNCLNLTLITCEAVTPPKLGSNVFWNVDKTIPVFVPEESINAYRSAKQWSEFANFTAIGKLASGKFKIGDLYYNLDGTTKTAEVTYQSETYPNYWSDVIKTANIPSSVILLDETYDVTSIGRYAFMDCDSLTSVTIPSSVKSIEVYAFNGCKSLTSIEIPGSVTRIESSAFYRCSGLTSIVILDGVTDLGYGAFQNCSNLTSLVISSTVKNIGEKLISGCDALSTIIGPAICFNEAIEKKSGGIVYEPNPPSKLKHITINAGVLNENGFDMIRQSYRSLISIDLEKEESSVLADEALRGCYNLQTLKLPSNLEVIGYMSMGECKSLKSVTIPASVTEIGASAFEDCRSLNDLTFAEGSILETIGSWAFYNCHNLPKIEIPEGVTEIGDAAFYGCVYAESLKLPASVQSIGDNAFALCSKLDRMDVDAIEPPAIVAKTFYEVSRKAPVYVPEASVDLYKSDPLWKEMNIVGRHDAPTAVETITNHQSPITNKILRNGQILILRGEKVYTVTGQEVR